MATIKELRRERVKRGIRKKIFGSTARPRLSVFRSNKDIYAQVIDDDNGNTVASASSRSEGIVGEKGKKIEISKKVGLEIARKAKEAGVSSVIFDRNGFDYHGRVKALAEGAREGGLIF